MNMIILLSGWKGSGKDLLASYLSEKHNFKQVSFAAALKDKTSEVYDIPRHFCDDRVLKEAPLLQYPIYSKDAFSKHVNEFLFKEFKTADGRTPNAFVYSKDGQMVEAGTNRELYHSPRSILILEGSVKRSVNSNYWVDRTIKEIANHKHVVISDWRYESELQSLISKTNEPIITGRIDRFKDTKSQDASERNLDGFAFNFKINNWDGEYTKEQVYAQMETALQNIELMINPSLWC